MATRRANIQRETSPKRYTHGLLSKTILITGEDPRRFSALLDTLRTTLQPTNPLEEALVDDLAMSRWRQLRAAGMETTHFNNEMQREAQLSDPILADNNAKRATRAFNSVSGENRAHDLMNRYELRFARHFNRTLRTLHELRRNTPKHKNEDLNAGRD